MQDITGNRKIIPLFIYGSLGGALTFILVYNLLPSLAIPSLYTNAVGASAGVMAVAVATTTVQPDYRIFPMINGGIPLWILTLVYVIINFASIQVGDPAKYIAHIAGAALGYVFIFQHRKGKDWSEWMNNL